MPLNDEPVCYCSYCHSSRTRLIATRQRAVERGLALERLFSMINVSSKSTASAMIGIQGHRLHQFITLQTDKLVALSEMCVVNCIPQFFSITNVPESSSLVRRASCLRAPAIVPRTFHSSTTLERVRADDQKSTGQ